MAGFLLDVPYFSQHDNAKEPHRSCNVSACSMVAEFIKPGVFKGSDDVYHEYLLGYGDSTEHGAHNRLLQAMGFKTEFKTNLGYTSLDASLTLGMPVVIGVLHRGHVSTPYGGHMIVVVGKKDNDYVVHDPWGEPFHYQNKDGKNCIVPTHSLDSRWLVDGDFTGWGRLFY